MPGNNEDRSRKRGSDMKDGQANKKKKLSPESDLRFSLDNCSKNGNVVGALEVYDKSRTPGSPKLQQYHYNLLLYMCASASLGVLPGKGGNGEPGNSEGSEGVKDGKIEFRAHMATLERKSGAVSAEVMEMAQNRGLEIFEKMKLENVPVNEATFTNLARLAVAKGDGDLAFQIVKDMLDFGFEPKLRSYGPALYAYFVNNQVDKAFVVYEHMVAANVQPEEIDLELLLDLSARAGLDQKVYTLLHQLRACLNTTVSRSTGSTIERWFRSEAGSRATGGTFEQEAVREALELKGGGGHELGWMGTGGWTVQRSMVNATGSCGACGETLAKVDLDFEATSKFADALEALACEKEQDKNSFRNFQKWLDRHGPFDAIVDGANVALYNQNYHAGDFSFTQLNTVVTKLEQLHGKLPLICLHKNRVSSGPANSREAQNLIKRWAAANALYVTPAGSNDDWFWLYAAVKMKCLLISNDEMRDHRFQLVGSQFFPKWKEKHQVRFDFLNFALDLRMPSPYSVLIQESKNGAWHIPIGGKDGVEWLCATRS